MQSLKKVLVVDEAKSSRETLCSVLSAHCQEVIEASGIGEAHEVLENESGFSLVVTEAVLTDGDAGDLLMEVGTLSGPKPVVVVVASRPSPEEAKRVQELGALAYLAKPISFLDLSRVLKRAKKDLVEVATRVLRQPLGTALVLDEETSQGDSRREVASHVLWDIHDISTTGAFLETRGPVRPGRELALGIVLDGQMLRVRVRVVRLQQPAWEHVSGIGVAFLEFDDGAKQELERFIQKHTKA